MLLANALARRDSVPMSSLNNPNTPIYQALTGGGSIIDAGVTVNESTAMRLSVVFRCIELISSVISSLPLKTYTGEGDSRVEVKRPSESYVWDKPNPEMTRQTFWEMVIASILANGNGYINTARTYSDTIGELWPVHPACVKIERNKSGEKIYIVNEVPMTSREIIHIPGFSMDGVYGLSKIQQYRQGLGINIAAERTAARLFANGTQLGGVLKTSKKDMTEESAAAMRASWKTKHGSVNNSWDVAILDADTEYIPTMVPPVDAQFLESRKYQDLQIAGLYGVPPHLVGIVDVSTSWGTGIEQQNIQFVNYTLRPLVTRLELAGTAWLLPPAARYMRFTLDGLLRGDTSARVAYYGAGRTQGWLSADDIRRREDMPPLPDGQGDVYQETPTGAAPNAGDTTGDANV